MGVAVAMADLKRPSSTVRNATEWPISDVSSDLTVEVGTSNFALHKFPLVSRSGRIRKLVLESKDPNLSCISLPRVPGGPEAFELAAKFCYGITIEITVHNVAMLRCASHYLEMTESFSEKNLETRTESYLKDTVFSNITTSISVLHSCETLVPVAEEIRLVPRLITSIVNIACKEQLTSGLSKLDQKFSIREPETPMSDWWGKYVAVLNLDFFQRVVSAMKSKDLNQDLITKTLINYTQNNSLQGIPEKKQRSMVEAVVSLLPTQSSRSPIPMGFLSSLLKAAIGSSAATSCRLDLERRVALQLDQASLEDILIPTANICQGGTMYDTDSVLRTFSIFLNLDEDYDDDATPPRYEMVYNYDSARSPKQSSILKVSKLLDSYLAEVALETNMSLTKFIALAELLPDHARFVSDELYRAIDIFLKVHPNIKDAERYRLCKTINSHKLSREACSHAAQNERLPVQMAVQVLYFEQIRLRNAMNGSGPGSGHNQLLFGAINSQFPNRRSGSVAMSSGDNYASVRRENRELKFEVSRMRMRLTDLEKDHVSMKRELIKPNLTNELLKSFTKKLSSKLHSMFRSNPIKPHVPEKTTPEGQLFQKRRRHSMS